MNAPADLACSYSTLDQLSIFRRAATTLASSLALDQTLSNTIAVFLPALGDFGFFDAVVDGGVRRTALAHDDAGLTALLSATRWERQEHPELNLCALSTGAAALHHDIDDAWYRRIARNDEHLAVLRALKFSAMLTVPLRTGDELIGALTLFMAGSGRCYLDGDLSFAAELAALAAPVVSNARLLARQRQAEQALRASEERLRLAVGAGGIGIWEWNLATDEVTWSDPLYLMHGLQPGQFGGRSADFLALVHPDDRAWMWNKLERSRAARTTMTAQFRAVRPDGAIVWLTTWAQWDGEGQPERLVGAAMDSTPQRQLNDALEQRLARRTSERDRIWGMSRDVLAVLSPGGELLSASPAFTRLLGWRHGELGASSLLDLVHPSARAPFEQHLDGAGGEIDVQMRHHDGQWRWLSWTLVREGGLVYAVGRDVTELKKQREHLLLASEKRLQLALDAGGMGVWQWDLVDDRIWWWPGMDRLHGLPPGTQIEKLSRYFELVEPADRTHLQLVVQEAMHSRQDYTVEYRVRLPDGEVRWLEGRCRFEFDDSGAISQLAGVCVDITQRKRTEDDLRFVARASEELARLDDIGATLQRVARLAVPHFADWCALDMLAADDTIERVAVAHTDPDKVRLGYDLFERYPPSPSDPAGVWQILGSGRAELFRHITDELIDQSTRDGEHRAAVHALGLRSYIGVPIATRGRTIGVMTFVSAESARLYNADDLALAEDIGRRAAIAIDNANLYRALQTADRRKDEFLAMLAHELRNPLAPIRAAADLLAMQRGDARLERISGVISRQVEHMTGLVDDLLDVSRVTRGNIVLDCVPVDVKLVVASALEQVRPLVDARNHRLQVDVAQEALTVSGDEKRLVQVLANLLGNAAKYTPPGGAIVLDAGVDRSGPQPQVRIEVRDNGIGMSAEMVACAFELFSQAARAADRAQGGLGLGLALVRRLVELHGGQVSALSKGEGQGSRFVVRLPALPAQAAAASGEAVDSRAQAPLRVLIVDDNLDAANVLGAFLETGGHQTDVCYDPFTALDRIAQQRYDVCLLDIGLPGMDGITLARRIRAECSAPQPLLVAVSGYGQAHDRSAALAGGFNHYLVKPVGALDLQALIREIGRA